MNDACSLLMGGDRFYLVFFVPFRCTRFWNNVAGQCCISEFDGPTVKNKKAKTELLPPINYYLCLFFVESVGVFIPKTLKHGFLMDCFRKYMDPKWQYGFSWDLGGRGVCFPVVKKIKSCHRRQKNKFWLRVREKIISCTFGWNKNAEKNSS